MTMPFLAQGGSSVIANWALVAILLRISDTARRPAPSPAPSPDAEADPGGPYPVNKPLRRVAVFCGLLILALLLRVTTTCSSSQADQLSNDPHNRRVAINQYAQPRGDIIVDGKAITGHTDDQRQRLQVQAHLHRRRRCGRR